MEADVTMSGVFWSWSLSVSRLEAARLLAAGSTVGYWEQLLPIDTARMPSYALLGWDSSHIHDPTVEVLLGIPGINCPSP